jgi:hypothetical protein
LRAETEETEIVEVATETEIEEEIGIEKDAEAIEKGLVVLIEIVAAIVKAELIGIIHLEAAKSLLYFG